MMPMLKHYGVGSIPWGPLGGGREYSHLALKRLPTRADARVSS